LGYGVSCSPLPLLFVSSNPSSPPSPVSAGIIELHGGRIGVWSAGEGEGSTFYFSLPLYGYAKDRRRGRLSLKRLYTIGDTSPLDGRQEHDEEEGEEEEHPSSRAIPISPHTPVSAVAAPSPVVSPLAALRILVVDDAPSIRKVVTRTLQSIGASCESASDGQSAINIVLSSSVSNSAGAAVFDLILMDNLMVPMGGLEATAELRRLGYSGLIIGATGNLLPEDIQLFLSAGADDVLGKPLSLADLESSVQRLLLQRSLKGQSSNSRTHTPPTTGRRPA
jgi:CheY-like chemotaxis protein